MDLTSDPDDPNSIRVSSRLLSLSNGFRILAAAVSLLLRADEIAEARENCADLIRYVRCLAIRSSKLKVIVEEFIIYKWTIDV